jgi:hypothetical protein
LKEAIALASVGTLRPMFLGGCKKMEKQPHDNLTLIKGIGPARQKWLGELFAVHTFEALGKLSVEEAEKKAKESGKILAHGDISDWIAQANQFATQKANMASPDNPKQKAERAQSLWRPFASFVVEFQEMKEADETHWRTKVHYMEADLEKTWHGIERDQIAVWIAQHIQITEEVEKPKTVQVVKQRAYKAAEIKPTEVRILQQPNYLSKVDVIEPERPFLGHVKHEQPVLLEVDFESDTDLMSEADHLSAYYTAQCQVNNVTHVEKTLFLEMEGNVSKNRLTYRTNLDALEPGMYRLAVMMRGKQPLGVSYFELPLLNVL